MDHILHDGGLGRGWECAVFSLPSHCLRTAIPLQVALAARNAINVASTRLSPEVGASVLNKRCCRNSMNTHNAGST